MLESVRDAYYYSQNYEFPLTDIFLIALNTCGAKSTLPFLRIRSYFIPKFTNKPFYLMICLNTSLTPFYLYDSKIYLNGEVVGVIRNLENDLAELCYFRKKKRVLVLNTNDRTRCIGKCTFCGIRYLVPRFERKILTFKELLKWFKEIEKIAKIKLSKLDEICLNTGLFENEEELVKHIIDIYNAATILNFKGEIKYIGTQLITDKNLTKISRTIPNFSYYLTLETLERRNFIDKRKQFSTPFYIKKVEKFLNKIIKHGFETSLLYVLGLDSLSSIAYAFQKFKKLLTRFPVINLFQAYHVSHESLRHPNAKRLKYFLNARKIFEEIFEDTNLRPKLWENYRGLWYTTFGGEKIERGVLQTFIRGY